MSDSSFDSNTSFPFVVETPHLAGEPLHEYSSTQVSFRTEAGQLQLILPPETLIKLEWPELWQQLQQRLDAGKRFWQPQTEVMLIAHDRLLDQRQLQLVADSLSEVGLYLQQICTSRRQTAVAAAAAGYSVDQRPVLSLQQPVSGQLPLVEPLYLQTTVRSGSEIRHLGTVVILGDLNPGSSVIADGDILVWGRLRGVAHAGAAGNAQCRIMALQMEPTQLRIADQVARAPEALPTETYPEVAYVTAAGIRIVKATEAKNTWLPLSSGQKLS